MGKVFAVGVGPGSPKYVTEIVKEIVQNCDIVIGYKYTLKTIEKFIEGNEIYEITMNDQEKSYQKILPELGDRTLVIPFTGVGTNAINNGKPIVSNPGSIISFKEA